MNTDTGELVDEALIRTMPESMKKMYVLAPHATEGQIKRGKVGRNEKCPCGSMQKFKKCCLNKQI